MKIDFKGLLEGAWNSIFVKEEIETICNNRMIICLHCDHRKKRTIIPFDWHCDLCGCNLEMKTRCLSCECPIKLWEAQVSEEEENKIEEKLKSQSDGEDK
jgi:hypothetical protein